MKAALYLRVSTDAQTVEVQRGAVEKLLEHSLRLGEMPTHVRRVDETESGAKYRPELASLAQSLRSGDVLAVWAIDRLGRDSVEVAAMLKSLFDRGVRVVSVQEPWLDQPGPIRQLLVFVFAWVAEQERARLIERTRAGLEHARSQGRVGGRRTLAVYAAALRLVTHEHWAWTAAAKQHGLTERGLRRYAERKGVRDV